MNVDASLLARTTLGGMINFLNTYASFGGKVTDLAKLNEPQAAEFYMKNFMQALGVEGQVSREAALKFADACARQILRVLGKFSQVNEQRTANQDRQPRGRSRQGTSTSNSARASRAAEPRDFKATNIFDTLEWWQRRRRKDYERDAKQSFLR